MTAGVFRACLSSLASLALVSGVVASDLPQVSENSPAFYQERARVLMQPGQWLDEETLPTALGLASAATQLRFVYSSTDGVDGQDLIAVSGVIFLPSHAAPEGGYPVVAWAHGTVGVADHCAPSRNPRSPRDVEYLSYWLEAGYAVVATDYQGLGMPGAHPYLNNRAAAYSVLDAIRAARVRFGDLGDQVLIVGQSQGAAAAISTAALAPDYAPELNILGTVATGVPNILASLSQANQAAQAEKGFDPAVAYMMYLAASIDESDPDRNGASAFHAVALPAYEMASHLCTMPMLGAVRDAGLTQAKAVSPAFLPLFSKEIAAIGYPTLQLAQPLFIGAGTEDIDTPAGGQLDIARQACRAGTLVEAHLYAGHDHATTVNRSIVDSRAFAARLRSGAPVEGRCEPTAE
jgi:pimeloyl-ACP methyl ester carboxylesterase